MTHVLVPGASNIVTFTLEVDQNGPDNPITLSFYITGESLYLDIELVREASVYTSSVHDSVGNFPNENIPYEVPWSLVSTVINEYEAVIENGTFLLRDTLNDIVILSRTSENYDRIDRFTHNLNPDIFISNIVVQSITESSSEHSGEHSSEQSSDHSGAQSSEEQSSSDKTSENEISSSDEKYKMPPYLIAIIVLASFAAVGSIIGIVVYLVWKQNKKVV